MEINIYIQRFIIGLAASCLMLASCKKNSSDDAYVNKPVVEAYLVQGQTLTVKLYQQKNLTDTATYGAALTGLSVSVSDGSKTVQLTEGTKGTYTYADLTFLSAGKTYTLQFKYNNVAVSATTIMPAKPVNYALTDSIFHVPTTINQAYADKTLATISWSNPDSLNHVLVFKNTDNDPFNIITVRSDNKPNFQINTSKAASYALTQSSFNYYGLYKVILLRVNDEYINLLTSNSERSSSQNLVNPPTNIVNGYGIFTAMQADTLNLRVTTQ
jgi:hypothetical protein